MISRSVNDFYIIVYVVLEKAKAGSKKVYLINFGINI